MNMGSQIGGAVTGIFDSFVGCAFWLGCFVLCRGRLCIVRSIDVVVVDPQKELLCQCDS